MADYSNIDFKQLISKYKAMQSKVMSQLNSLRATGSGVSPTDFLWIQFKVTQLSQVGDSISNIVSQINSMINNSIRNYKGT